MSFAAKSAIPDDADEALRQPVLEQAAEGGLTLFTAPAGYLLTGSLAAALDGRGRSVSWLRLGPEDRDPAVLILSLIASGQRISPGLGTATLSQMRRRPGPLEGWPRLFEHLGRELAKALPASSAIVLEHVHYLNDTQPTLVLLGHYILPALPSNVTCILASHEPLPPAALPTRTAYRGVNDLRLADNAALHLLERAEAKLPTALVYRANALVGGRAGVLADLFSAVALLGQAFVQQAIKRATGLEDLLTRIARAWLATVNAETLQTIALAARLEFCHPTLIQAAIENATLPAGPWLQPLADNWTRVRHVWQAPLRAALRVGSAPKSDTLRRAADYLVGQGAVEQAVPLYFEIGDAARAAQAISGAADTMMDLGEWETLGNWLGRLPTPTLHAWPQLVYTGGEIAAVQGQADTAGRAFAGAAALFAARHDADGACRSLLSESVAAARQGDRAYAQTRALAASAMAEAAGLASHQAWAIWQLGGLAAAAGELDDALTYFNQAIAAASLAGDPLMFELLRETEALTLRQRDLRRQREFHRRAYFTAEQAERETAERLHLVISNPPGSFDALLGAHGWSRTPLMLKLPAPTPPAEMPAAPERTSRWSRLLSALGVHRRSSGPATAPDPGSLMPPGITAPETMAFVESLPLATPSATSSVFLGNALPSPVSVAVSNSPPAANVLPSMPDAILAPDRPAAALVSSLADSTVEPPQAPMLTAHLLGTFRVSVDEHLVESRSAGRGRAVFKYLLTNHGQPPPRDVLMDVFWPNADPEAARNSLNVALHGLRRALRNATDVSVIVFQDGAYRLNPDLRLWLDTDEFERHVQAGRRLEAVGHLAAAAAEYELAIGLYQGDFLADDPYEEWPILTRERLRVAYLDTLDRLSQISFSQGQYASCITLCQLILARDNCREDAHCLLMRCYSRQGQHHLALRQYQVCVEALRADLDVVPAPATTQLYERIRRREGV